MIKGIKSKFFVHKIWINLLFKNLHAMSWADLNWIVYTDSVALPFRALMAGMALTGLTMSP